MIFRRIFISIVLVSGISTAALCLEIEQVTGKIAEPGNAIDGSVETAALVTRIENAGHFDFIAYLDSERSLDSLDIDLSPDPGKIEVETSLDIVTWEKTPISVERTAKTGFYSLVINLLKPRAAKYARVRVIAPGVDTLHLYEVSATAASAEPNAARDVEVEHLNDTTVLITYKTDFPSQTNLRYGPEGPVFNRVYSIHQSVTEHVARLDKLVPGTQYYYQIIFGGENEMSPVFSFKTTGEPPPVISKIHMPDPGPRSAKIQLKANKPVRWKITWGPYSTVMTEEEAASDPSAQVFEIDERGSVELLLRDLAPRRRYFFIVEAEDSAGKTAKSDLLGFDTAPVNLALGKPVDGTFTHELIDKYIEKTDTPMARVTDGDLNYHTGFAKSRKVSIEDQWIEIDLGGEEKVSEVVVCWSELAVPEDYTVSVRGEDGEAGEILDVKDGEYPENVSITKTRSPRADPLVEVSVDVEDSFRFLRLDIPAGTKIDSRIGWKYAVLAEVRVLAPGEFSKYSNSKSRMEIAPASGPEDNRAGE